MLHIFKREIKDHRNSLVFWSIGIFLLVASGMAKYSVSTASGTQTISDLVNAMPKTMQSILGIGSFDLTKANEYYGMLFLYIAVMAAIHATTIGSDIIAKEERDKTSEFLFVKPVSRVRIISEKILAAIFNIIILNIVTLVSSLVIVGKYSNGESVKNEILVLMAGMFMIQLLFMSIGTAIAAINNHPRSSSSISNGVLLFTFIISVAIDINSKYENLKWITPFKYFDAKNLIRDGHPNLLFTSLSLVIVIILLSATYAFYNKRDLNI